MDTVPERSRNEAYAQAHEALRKAATVIAPVLAEAQTGLVVLLDIAGMGDVNTRYGVPIGDRLLRAVEDSLRAELNGTAQVARLAGDQFLVVAPDPVSVELMVASILHTLAWTRVRGRWWQSVRVSAHVGTAIWRDEASRRTAISAAGKALAERDPLMSQAFTRSPRR
jgi:diguanylate cyclase (GGDEF)-like protein